MGGRFVASRTWSGLISAHIKVAVYFPDRRSGNAQLPPVRKMAQALEQRADFDRGTREMDEVCLTRRRTVRRGRMATIAKMILSVASCNKNL